MSSGVRAIIDDEVASLRASRRDDESPLLLDPDGLKHRLLDSLFGLGILQPLMDDPRVEEIIVNGPLRIFAIRDGRKEPVSDAYFENDDELRQLVKRVVSARWPAPRRGRADGRRAPARRLAPERGDPTGCDTLSKIHRFQGSRRRARSSGSGYRAIDPAAWLRDGSIVIVNTARGTVGENAAALIGGTLLNLVDAGRRRAGAAGAGRRGGAITMFVDEFHTHPGRRLRGDPGRAEQVRRQPGAGHAEPGAPARARTASDERGLRATVFANLDGLFAFNCSAEDARYLVPELGGAIDEQDLLELGEHQCYVRLSSRAASGCRRFRSHSIRR